MANEHQIRQGVQLAGRDTRVASCALAAKGVDMRFLCNIYLFLRHARLPQGLIASAEFASSSRPAPQQTLDRYRNAAGNFLGDSYRRLGATIGVSRTLRSHLANGLPSAKPFSRRHPFVHPVQSVTFFAQTFRSY